MPNLHCGLITLEPPEGGFITPIAEGLTDNGCEVQVLHRHSEWEVQPYDFLLTYGPMQSMAWAIVRLSQFTQVPPVVVWFTEQVPFPQPNLAISLAAKVRYYFEESSFRHKTAAQLIEKSPLAVFLRRAGRLRALGELLALKSRGLLRLICVFTDTNAAFLRYYRLPVAVVPMGSHPQFGKQLNYFERDIDVVFLGSTQDKRRREIIRELDNKLKAKGVNFVIKDGSPTRGHIFGEARDHLLNRSKIMLNIMRQPWDDPVFRLLLAAPAGAMLLSEKLLPASIGPFESGKHFAISDLPDIVAAIEYYISHDTARQEITGQAFEYVTKELTMRNMAQKVLIALGSLRS